MAKLSCKDKFNLLPTLPWTSPDSRLFVQSIPSLDHRPYQQLCPYNIKTRQKGRQGYTGGVAWALTMTSFPVSRQGGVPFEYMKTTGVSLDRAFQWVRRLQTNLQIRKPRRKNSHTLLSLPRKPRRKNSHTSSVYRRLCKSSLICLEYLLTELYHSLLLTKNK